MKRILLLLSITLAALSPDLRAQQPDYVATPVTVSKEKVKMNGKVFLSHVVLERQTLFGIAKAYGVGVEDIIAANPSIQESGLQKNAIILIPLRENVADPEETKAGASPEYTEHTVRWFEDLDDIARKYGVAAKDIMEYNHLKSKKVSARQVLRIPLGPIPSSSTETAEKEKVAETKIQEPAPVENTPAPEVPATTPEEEEEEDADFSFFQFGRNEVTMALLMPLNAGGKTSEVNMDFYSGVLMAVKDLEKDGIQTNLNVYDLAAGLPSRDALTRGDFVLGPVATRDLEAVLERVDGKVPVISPLDQKAVSLSATYPGFIQAPTSVDNAYMDLCRWLSDEMHSGDRIILITEKGAKSTTAAVSIRNALAQHGLTYDILNYAIVEGRGIPAILTSKMAKSGVNRMVVASESEAFIGDVMRNLGIMQGKGYDLVMYAPSRVRTFDTIDGSTYHKAQLHMCSSYFVDYNDPQVNQFVLAYRALFKTEPSQFAFQGYDTARYFISRCARYGRRWLRKLPAETVRGLHTDFLFVKDGNGNYQNTAVRRIIYQPDYTTTLEK